MTEGTIETHATGVAGRLVDLLVQVTVLPRAVAALPRALIRLRDDAALAGVLAP